MGPASTAGIVNQEFGNDIVEEFEKRVAHGTDPTASLVGTTLFAFLRNVKSFRLSLRRMRNGNDDTSEWWCPSEPRRFSNTRDVTMARRAISLHALPAIHAPPMDPELHGISA